MNDFDGIKRTAPQIRVEHGLPGQTTPQKISLVSAGRSKKSRRWLKIVLLMVSVLIIVLGTFVVSRAVNLSNKIFVGKKLTFFQTIGQLFKGTGKQSDFTTSENGQVNILLLGVGGEGHDGPYLTDTMILAQIRPTTGEVVLTSIPRDYLVDLPKNLKEQKINSAFFYGLDYKPGTKNLNLNWNQGGEWARGQVEKMSGLSIPYFAVIDFSGFEKAINQVGGIDITVDRTFTDYEYPDNGVGYLPPQTFTAGPLHLDGAKALIFSRSRHAAGLEGSDFSRSQRQQKIISAFESKILSGNLIKDASTINNLLSIFADHFHTNLLPSQIYQLYTISKDKNNKILSLSLDPDTGLVCPEILASTGAYVLVPCKSKDDVENFFKNSFAIGKLTAEESVVWLASSTGNKAAYNSAFRQLTNAGLVVYQLSYTKDDLPETIVYQATPKPATVEFVKNVLGATEATLPPPGVTVTKGKVDVIVVLGANAPILPEPTPYIPPPARQATTSTSTINSTSSTSTASSTHE